MQATTRHPWRIFAGIFFLSLSPFIFSQTSSDNGAITANYQDADIREIINAVSAVSDKTFIVDPRVKAQVTMVSSAPMTADAFYNTFLSILEVYGFVAVDSGGVIKILPDTNARQQPTDDYKGITKQPADDMITHVVQLQNVGAAQLVPILRPLVPQYGHLAAHPASNMLIVSDRVGNVNRLLKIIARIDQSSDSDVEVIPLEHASALDLSQTLTSLTQVTRGDANASSPFSVVADDRTNSLIIGGDKSTRLRFRTLIAHLDTPLEDGGNTQVMYLKYADAEELSGKLKEQINQENQGANNTANQRVTIWSDQSTNALVITAPPKTMRSLKSVINQLDIRRAQVQIETVIADISNSDNINLGVAWAADGGSGEDVLGLIDLDSPSRIQPIIGQLIGGDDTISSTLPAGVNVAFGRFKENGTSFGALVSALASDSSTDILSRPTIVTMDNEEAELTVGREVPFLTGQFTNTGSNNGSVNPFSTIERRDVGIKLKVTPQINEGNAVILTIELEVSNISSEEIEGATDLVTLQRTIRQKIVVEDQAIVILGGLIEDNSSESRSRVPILGSLPLIGHLFRSQSSSLSEQNLMVFLRPTILRDGIDTSRATNQKYRYIRDRQLEQDPRINLMRSKRRPILPSIEELMDDRVKTGDNDVFSDRFNLPEVSDAALLLNEDPLVIENAPLDDVLSVESETVPTLEDTSSTDEQP